MAVSDGFFRVTGNGNFRKYNVLSGQTFTPGDCCQFDETGAVSDGATNVEILGLALETVASGTAPMLVDILQANDECTAKVESGTMSANEIGEEADINSDDGITLTESNNDCLIVGWDRFNTDQAFVVFKNLVYGA